MQNLQQRTCTKRSLTVQSSMFRSCSHVANSRARLHRHNDYPLSTTAWTRAGHRLVPIVPHLPDPLQGIPPHRLVATRLREDTVDRIENVTTWIRGDRVHTQDQGHRHHRVAGAGRDLTPDQYHGHHHRDEEGHIDAEIAHQGVELVAVGEALATAAMGVTVTGAGATAETGAVVGGEES